MYEKVEAREKAREKEGWVSLVKCNKKSYLMEKQEEIISGIQQYG